MNNEEFQKIESLRRRYWALSGLVNNFRVVVASRDDVQVLQPCISPSVIVLENEAPDVLKEITEVADMLLDQKLHDVRTELCEMGYDPSA